jgi:ribosomal protein L37AE/L43A
MSGPRTILDAFKALFFKEIDDYNKAQRKKRIVPPCPHCTAKCTVRIQNHFHCNQCGKDFGPPEQYMRPMSRAKWLEENPQKEPIR